MIKKEGVFVIIFSILLVASIGFNIYLSNKEVGNSESEKKALLDVQIDTWGYNEDNSNELLFSYWISNYGEVESKNVNVRCKLFDGNDVLSFSALNSFGNLASTSTEYGEFTPPKNFIDMNKEYYPICYVESCENCEVLYKRISALSWFEE